MSAIGLSTLTPTNQLRSIDIDQGFKHPSIPNDSQIFKELAKPSVSPDPCILDILKCKKDIQRATFLRCYLSNSKTNSRLVEKMCDLQRIQNKIKKINKSRDAKHKIQVPILDLKNLKIKIKK